MARLPVTPVVWTSLILLLAAAVVTALLYRAAHGYYRDLQSARLDPLGLAAYPVETAGFQQSNGRTVVVFFGDSRAQQWPSPTQVSGLTFVNRGIHSQTTAQVLGRMSAHVLPLKPTIVLLQVGMNDLKTIPLFPDKKEVIVSNCKRHIEEIVAIAFENDSRVVLTTIFPIGEVPLIRRLVWSEDVALALEEVNEFIRTLRNDRVIVFDAARILAGPDGRVDPRFSENLLHLNAAGYEALNRELTGVLGVEGP